MSDPDDADLTTRLEELHRTFEARDDDVIVVWQAIRFVAKRNQHPSAQPYPMPPWVNDYLLRCAEKVGRLSLGIRPEDDRSLHDIGPSNVGELRKVCRGARYRDERKEHVAAALGFAVKGVNAFQRHDRANSDAQYLGIYDDPDLADNKPLQKEVRQTLLNAMMKNEGINDTQSAYNRLSKARQRPT